MKEISVTDHRGELKVVLAMTVPMVVSTCSPMVMRIVDFAFVSALGTDAQAAIVPTQILLWCYIAFCVGLTTTVSTFASQSLGREKPSDCSAYAWQSLYLSLSLGLLGLAWWPAFPVVFAWIGHEPALQALEISYAQVSVWAMVPTIGAQALGAFFTGVHRPKTTMMAALEGNVLNIFLNYALIFGAWGFPALGFTGAAVGTVLAAYYQLIRLLVSLLSPATDKAFSSRTTWAVDLPKMRALVRVGGSQGVYWFSDLAAWALFTNLLVGRFGTLQLAASNVIWQYIRIGIMPMFGLGQALTSLVGKAIGQGDRPRAMRLTRISVALGFVYLGTLSVVYVLNRHGLVGLFNADEEVIAVGAKLMICLAIFQLFDAMGIVYQRALVGAGDTAWPTVVSVVCQWSLLIGGGFVVVTWHPEYGSLGPWVVAMFQLALTGGLMCWRWYSGRWMRIDIFRHERSGATDISAGSPEEQREPAALKE